MDEALSKAMRELQRAGMDPFIQVVIIADRGEYVEEGHLYLDLRKVTAIQHVPGRQLHNQNTKILLDGNWINTRWPDAEVDELIQRWQGLRILERN